MICMCDRLTGLLLYAKRTYQVEMLFLDLIGINSASLLLHAKSVYQVEMLCLDV